MNHCVPCRYYRSPGSKSQGIVSLRLNGHHRIPLDSRGHLLPAIPGSLPASLRKHHALNNIIGIAMFIPMFPLSFHKAAIAHACPRITNKDGSPSARYQAQYIAAGHNEPRHMYDRVTNHACAGVVVDVAEVQCAVPAPLEFCVVRLSIIPGGTVPGQGCNPQKEGSVQESPQAVSSDRQEKAGRGMGQGGQEGKGQAGCQEMRAGRGQQLGGGVQCMEVQCVYL